MDRVKLLALEDSALMVPIIKDVPLDANVIVVDTRKSVAGSLWEAATGLVTPLPKLAFRLTASAKDWTGSEIVSSR
jgi:hypothetical protein